MNTTCYLLNRKPMIVSGLRTPKEMYMCKKSNLSNLRVFGTLIYVHAPKENKISYLKGLSKKPQWIYRSQQGISRCFILLLKKIIVSRNIVLRKAQNHCLLRKLLKQQKTMMFIYTLRIFKTTFNIVQQLIQWQSTLSTLNQGSLFTYL